ncbi:MAG TPA: response regulator [Steroidobacteraceae bacterium]|nr:response regulator [Steroidobacteraceae bacterium]
MVPGPKKYVTSLEAAGLLMVSPVTIREWARKGLLPSVSTAGGHRRFLLDQLRQFAARHGIALEGEVGERAAEPERVLLVDDDTVFAEYLREIVLRSGSPVIVKTARDGFEAGQLTEVFRPRIVVLDINMPRIDGIELCRRLRATPTTAGSRIVILSGSLSEENVSAARSAGADAWIEKGASRAEILGQLGLGGAPGARGAAATG